MNFTLYIVGFTIFIGGLAWGAIVLGAPPLYVGIGVVILVGLGIMSAVVRTRRPEGGSGGSDVTVIKDND